MLYISSGAPIFASRRFHPVYVASGTDLAHVAREVELLELAPFLGRRVSAPRDNDATFRKRDVIEIERVGARLQPSNMSFSLRDDTTGLEYNGTSLNALFAQRHNLLRPSFLRMLATRGQLPTYGALDGTPELYGGSYRMFTKVFAHFGIVFNFVDMGDAQEIRKHITSKTKMIWVETPTNPIMKIIDIAAVAAISKEKGLLLVVDNTFASPVLCRPLTLGADIVFHSATKFIGGHGVAIGGVIVESGRFDWEASGKFPTLTEPYAGYHGIDYAEEFGPQAFIMRARAEGVRDFGCCLAPQNAFYLLQGLETLPLRASMQGW